MAENITKRRPTVVDVAKRANVSQGTVSRYLNGLPVRAGNRERVAAAIEEMNYTRNAIATAMRATSRKMIGLLVPDIDGFHARLLGALTVSLSKDGIGTLTMCHEVDACSIKEAIAYFQVHRVDAIVISGSDDCAEELMALEKHGVRIITYDSLPAQKSFNSVTVDNRAISQKAVKHLLDLGHRDIGILCGDLKDWTAQERLKGWHDAFIQAGLTPPQELICRSDWTKEGGELAFRTLCETVRVPTAMYVSNYTMTTGLLNHCNAAGIHIPQDLSLVSFDDVELFEFTTPPLSGVAQPVNEIATAIKQILTNQVYQRSDNETEHIVLPCSLNFRGSTAPPKPGRSGRPT